MRLHQTPPFNSFHFAMDNCLPDSLTSSYHLRPNHASTDPGARENGKGRGPKRCARMDHPVAMSLHPHLQCKQFLSSPCLTSIKVSPPSFPAVDPTVNSAGLPPRRLSKVKPMAAIKPSLVSVPQVLQQHHLEGNLYNSRVIPLLLLEGTSCLVFLEWLEVSSESSKSAAHMRVKRSQSV